MRSWYNWQDRESRKDIHIAMSGPAPMLRHLHLQPELDGSSAPIMSIGEVYFI